MKQRTLSRRALLRGLGAAALAAPFGGLLRTAVAGPPLGKAQRIVFFYFPDGIPAPGGQASRWHAQGSETSFTLAENLQPLASFKGDCAFLNGLSLGPTDAGSHPGGAKKLLTGVDGGAGESLDRYLARTVGAGAPFKHLYLGAQATANNASGDKFVSYPSAGTTVAPEDDPLAAFQRLFGQGATTGGGTTGPDPTEVSVLDAVMKDLETLGARAGDVEKKKLDLHMEALRDVEKRVKGMPQTPTSGCNKPQLSAPGVSKQTLFDPATFPAICRAQIDVMVQAMACGLTQVGVVQLSQHTSELVMSRFPNTPLYKANYDMRSHQASHYGVPSDPKFTDYALQRTWFVSQFAYLLDQLKQRPEGQGTMLDYSIVVLCSEVSDGNTHSHDDMPFVVAGKAGGALRTGRLFSYGYRRHSDILATLARAMGDTNVWTWGQGGQGPLPGLLV
jgi:hypothetical protein